MTNHKKGKNMEFKFYILDDAQKSCARNCSFGKYTHYFIKINDVFYIFDANLSVSPYIQCLLKIDKYDNNKYIDSFSLTEVKEDNCHLSIVPTNILKLFTNDSNVDDINAVINTWASLGFIGYFIPSNFEDKIKAWYNSVITAYNEKTNSNCSTLDLETESMSDVEKAAYEYLKYKPSSFGSNKEDLIEMFKAGATWCGNM